MLRNLLIVGGAADMVRCPSVPERSAASTGSVLAIAAAAPGTPALLQVLFDRRADQFNQLLVRGSNHLLGSCHVPEHGDPD
jgi:hypothetical protein